MAQVSDWSTLEQNNVKLDDLTLSGEGGLYSNKIMCAVKKKFDDVDGKLSKVQGAYVFKGTKADMTALEAVEDPAVGDVYSVTDLGGENYAWDGDAWDSLGTSDANVVHKTGDETINGEKKFNDTTYLRTIYSELPVDSETGLPTETQKLAIVSLDNKNKKTKGFIELSFYANGGTISRLGAQNKNNIQALLLVDCQEDDTKVVRPGGNGSTLLGKSDARWGQIYSTSSTISTSDARQKTKPESIPDECLDAWSGVSFCQFKMLESVEKKGKSARLHAGLIAQDIEKAFKEKGLDASIYGLFCWDEWGEKKDEVNDEGIVVDEGHPAGDMYSLRYEEALCMEAAYQRRRADRAEARIASLEERLASLEAAVNGK